MRATKVAKYFAVYKMGIGKSMEYKFDFFFGLLSVVFPVIIQTYLWSAIYTNGSNINYGYSYGQIMLYTFSAGIVAQFIYTGVENRINEDIHTGQLGNYLVRPISYAPYRLLSAMGEKLFEIFISFSLLTAVLLVLPKFFTLAVSALSVLLFIPALLLGFMLSFLLYYCIGMMGLWFIEIGKLFGAIHIVTLVFSGGVFPLEVFGEKALFIMRFLPLMYITYFPTRVLNGSADAAEIALGMSLQLMWIALFFLLSGILWNAGIKRYAPVGT